MVNSKYKKKKGKRGDTNAFDIYLHPDENLLWWGQPNPNRVFSGSDIIMIPFSLFWGGFAYWVGYLSLTEENFDLSFMLIVLLFVIVGSYLMWGRFIHHYLVRQNLFYGITDQRLIILRRFGNAKIFSLPLESAEIKKQSYDKNGDGTIFFNTFPHIQDPKQQTIFKPLNQSAFVQIDDVDNAMEVLLEVLTRPDVDWSDRLDSEWWDKAKAKRKNSDAM